MKLTNLQAICRSQCHRLWYLLESLEKYHQYSFLISIDLFTRANMIEIDKMLLFSMRFYKTKKKSI